MEIYEAIQFLRHTIKGKIHKTQIEYNKVFRERSTYMTKAELEENKIRLVELQASLDTLNELNEDIENAHKL